MDVVLIVITNIVTTNEEVKNSKWLEDSSSFDILVGDPKCDLMLELASTTRVE